MRQRGNILFLILLAVVLFAALAYAVTSSMRGGGADSAMERNSLISAQLLQSATMTSNALTRLMLMTDKKVGQIDLSSSQVTYGDVAGCTANSCNLFHPDGGGASPPMLLPKDAIDPAATSCLSSHGTPEGLIKPAMYLVSVGNVGTDAPELMLYQCGLKRSICDQINMQAGLWKPGDAPISNALGAGNVGYTPYATSVTYPLPSLTPGQLGSTDARIKGAQSWCVWHGTTISGIFYFVLAEN